MQTSLIKYFGGKGGIMTKNIVNMLYPNRTVFIDAFGGSGKILMGQNSKIEIYNDIYSNVYSLFRVISDKKLFDEFRFKCELAVYSDELRKEYKELLKTELSIVDRAFYYFFVNRTSHNGVGGFAVNFSIRNGTSKSVADYLSAVKHLPDFHSRWKNVIIYNKDVFELLKLKDAENVMLYLDPPYHQSTRTNARYEHDFTDLQHENLIDFCLNAKSKILISGYDCELYENLVKKGWIKKQYAIKTVSGTKEAKTKIETIWMNYLVNRDLFS